MIGHEVFPTNPIQQNEITSSESETYGTQQASHNEPYLITLGITESPKQLGLVTKSRTSEIQFEMCSQTNHTLQGQISAFLHLHRRFPNVSFGDCDSE